MTTPMEWPTPKHQAPSTKHLSSRTSGRQAQSVTREARSGPGWEWWTEVNPIDGEVCAQPWSNLGLVDAEHDGTRRVQPVGQRRRCSSCDHNWHDGITTRDLDEADALAALAAIRCEFCGQPPDDDWTVTGPGMHDGARRSLEVPGAIL